MSERTIIITIILSWLSFFVLLYFIGLILGKITDLRNEKKLLEKYKQELPELKAAKTQLETLQDDYQQLLCDYLDLSENHTRILKSLSFDLPAFDCQDQDDVSRLHNALRENIEANCENITATFVSQSPGRKGTRYTTTLTSCDCKDRDNHPTKPCKHMFALALRMNAELSPLRDVDRKLIIEYTELKKDVDKEKREIKRIVSTTSQRSPWLAKRIAEYYDQIDRERIASIPRSTKKEELDRLRREKKQLLIERNELQSQLDYLIHKFPDIEQHMKLPPQI